MHKQRCDAKGEHGDACFKKKKENPLVRRIACKIYLPIRLIGKPSSQGPRLAEARHINPDKAGRFTFRAGQVVDGARPWGDVNVMVGLRSAQVGVR